MSDRLKFFRRLMSAFEGTSNPQRAVERGFYVNLPNNPVGEITRRIELRPSSVHLLFGGIGSGKTTQLLLTEQALNELEDIKAFYIDVSVVTDISDLKSGALIALAGLHLIQFLALQNLSYNQFDNIDNTEIENSEQIIRKAAFGYTETKVIETSLTANLSSAISAMAAGSKSVTKHYKGLLSFEKDKSIELILEAFSTLKQAVRNITNKEIVFLFDGLDRLSDSQTFIDSALDDVFEIKNIGIGSVLVGSVVTVYAEKDSIASFDCSSYYMPYLNVLENTEVQKFFADVITVRDSDNFINSEIRLYLVLKSGGVLRDLMSLCQAAIEEAYVDGSDQITLQHANQAVLALARSKMIGLTDSKIYTLHKVVTEKSFSPRTAEDFELLLSGHILEYRYPRQRFVVHPILAPIIENMVASVANG